MYKVIHITLYKNNMGIKYIYGTDEKEVKNILFKTLEDELNNKLEYKIIILTDKKDNLEKDIRRSGVVDKNLRLKILSIEDLCRITLKNSRYNIRNLLSDNKKNIVLTKLSEQPHELKEYTDIITNPSVVKTFSKTITKLKEELIDTKKLKLIISSLEDSITRRKLEDILCLYESYEKFKNDELFDYEDMLLRASTLVRESTFLKNSSLYLVGFEQFNKLEELIITSVIITAKNNTFVFNTDRVDRKPTLNSNHFYKIDLLIDRINKICDKNNVVRGSDIIASEYNSIEEVNHLKEFLYKYPFNCYNQATTYLTVNEYKSSYAEVENVALNILELIHDGVSLEDIKIITFNKQEYNALFEMIFKQYKIPFNSYNNSQLCNYAIVKAIRYISEMHCNNFSTKDVINYLKIMNQLESRDLGEVENYLKRMIDDKINLDEEVISTLERNANTEPLFIVYEHIKPVKELLKKLDNNENIYDKGIVLFSELKHIFYGGIEDEELNSILESTDITIWNTLANVISTIAKIYDNEILDTKRFLELIVLNLSNIKIIEGESLNNRVEIIYDKAIPSECKYLFILNANENTINFKDEENLILNEIDNKTLRKIGVNIGYSSEIVSLIEEYSIYKLLTSAQNRVSISIPLSDRLEQRLKPSQVVTRVKQLFPKYSSLQEYKLSLNELDKEVIKMIPSEINTLILADSINENQDFEIRLLDELKEIESFSDSIEVIKKALTFKNNAICSDKYALNQLYFSDIFSVSKIESYKKCPFSYFIEYGLKLKEVKKNVPDFSHTGIFLHKIVESFGKRLSKNKVAWSEVTAEYIKSEVETISQTILIDDGHILTATPKHRAHISKLKAIAVNSIEIIVRQINNSFFEAAGHEITFGEKASYPPITIRLDNGKRIKLRGQIDRIDELNLNGKTYIRIIDYKTGKNVLSFNDIFYGLQLQLITYLDAIINSSKNLNCIPAGVFYLRLDNPNAKLNPKEHDDTIRETLFKELRMNGFFNNEDSIPQLMDKDVFDGMSKNSLNINARFKNDGTLMKATPGLSSKEFDILIRHTKNVIKNTVTDMLDCNIEIKPILKNGQTPCNYCSYKNICLFDESLEGNNYRFIKTLKPAEAFENIKEQVGLDYE